MKEKSFCLVNWVFSSVVPENPFHAVKLRKYFMHMRVNEVAGCKSETFRNNHWRCAVKKGFPKNFANFTGKHLCCNLCLIKLQFWRPATLLKKTPTQGLSCEICEIFKNKLFEEHLWETSCKLSLKNKKRLEHRWFPVRFMSYLRTPFLLSFYERLVLKHQCGGLSLIKLPALWPKYLYQY